MTAAVTMAVVHSDMVTSHVVISDVMVCSHMVVNSHVVMMVVVDSHVVVMVDSHVAVDSVGSSVHLDLVLEVVDDTVLGLDQVLLLVDLVLDLMAHGGLVSDLLLVHVKEVRYETTV